MGADLPNVRAIFCDALEKAPGQERAAYLEQVCGNRPDLRSQVEELLRLHEGAGSFLESPLLDPETILDPPAITEGPGSVIGRYKLLEKIGEGGMAVVYMAEQERPIRRKVALKIIKLGMDTRQVIARFEAERQALAMMDHPSIAKVLDAGATETGRPYFVMELVQGVSITDYCDRNSLSTKDRLRLFLQVCHAVQHAHQKGIIHRDLKPSNVMVTHHDGQPMPKVIDFGIAKATNQRLTEKTLFTRYAHLIGTPAYMSPEQAELSDLDIDTRTDIYSLGVLLYELLTGATPFSEEELRKAGYIEMQRVIREQEPAKPSTRLTTLGDTLTDIAKHRGCTPELLRRAVRGDLDWIVMKSLEKDRARRYETPNGLASDILRHLEHEPVLAHGPGAAYHLRKFLRRHRSQVISAFAVAVVVVAAAVVLSLWNRDRAQLTEAEGFKHRGILSQAREQYAKADRDAALETIKPILDSKHVGPEAQLLQATILVDNRHPDEAVTILNTLLNERPEITGAAHSLLARILWESDSADSQKPKEIEDHRRQAEASLPETAEAYFLRAMTAVTVKEQLASLDKALQLDSSNYESRRLRAFTYYASRKYDRMNEDSLVMTVLRPRDALGYSLRAAALRELGKYKDAIVEYDNALAFVPQGDPQHTDLSVLRCETLLRMGDYERVTADAQECFKLWPDKPVFQYYTFGALTALGEYDTATTLFREIIAPGHEARQQLRDWCAKYVFESLQAGRPWHPSDRVPVGAAFLPLVEAEETYQHLSAKAKRVIVNGFTTRWSPDGKKLAFSMGVHGYSGVAIYDLATKETDLLIVPGKEPAWSPDGQYIAFVRDCQALRVSEFATAERKPKPRPREEEEVWVMKSDGTEPRRLARGGWPSWSRDSQRVYYQSRADNTLCSISIVEPEAKLKRIIACPNPFPSVSPDEQWVAYLEAGRLKVKDLASQAVVAEWTVPPLPWVLPTWSPTGRELCMGSSAGAETKMGLWVYRLDGSEPLKVLDSQITAASWAPDGTKLVFHLGAPYYEIWTADLDPNTPSIETLGPAQTSGQHFRQMVAFHSRRIRTDPQDASAYADRARYYDNLHEQLRAQIDMKRWSVVMSGKSPSGLWFGTPRDLGCILDLPFDCELVFSAERPVNMIPMISIAFGQKGRCEMKLFEIPMLAMSLLGLGLFSGLDVPAAHADFTFGQPVNLRSAIPGLDPAYESVNSLSSDGLEMYIESGRPGGCGGGDLWVLRRVLTGENWGPPDNLGPVVNSSQNETYPCISADGLTLYFSSTRPGGYGNWDLYVTTRASRNAPWGTPVNLGSRFNTAASDCSCWISSDGLELYFESGRPGGYDGGDLYVSKRATQNDSWSDAANLGPVVNSAYADPSACLSPDGLVLFFSALYDSPVPPGGLGGFDIWMTRRASREGAWQEPVNIGTPVNGSADDCIPRISPDGSTLYFATCSAGSWENWQAPIVPIVDFNGDGKVDVADMDLLVTHWGTNEPLCDIGPFPWGDGVVDEKDLAVLVESLMTPGPGAADVPCDVVLNWISPSIAEGSDVYLGTSFEAVSTADRDHPLDVLVSWGQLETTYTPEEPLEFSQTYYWRIDTVLGPSNTSICKGPVLSFSTEPYARVIQNIIATASAAQVGMGPQKTVDGSGLDKNDGHSTTGTDMWQSANVAGPHWIQFEFDQVYALQELWVWNSNQLIEPFLGFGAKTVKIEYSTDGATWTALDGVPEFAKAPGLPGYVADTIVSFGGVSAQYVRLTIEKGWGVTQAVGLSEVRFFYIPDRSATQP